MRAVCNRGERGQKNGNNSNNIFHLLISNWPCTPILNRWDRGTEKRQVKRKQMAALQNHNLSRNRKKNSAINPGFFFLSVLSLVDVRYPSRKTTIMFFWQSPTIPEGDMMAWWIKFLKLDLYIHNVLCQYFKIMLYAARKGIFDSRRDAVHF